MSEKEVTKAEVDDAMEMLGSGYHVSEKASRYFVEKDQVIAFKRMYVDVMGDIVGALWLSQLAYWQPKAKRTDGFVYKSYDEWEKETGLSKYQIKRSADKAEDMGIVEVKLKRANGAPTLHYRINHPKLNATINSIIKFLDNQETVKSDSEVSRKSDSEETGKSLTENTHKNTTKTTTTNDGNLFSTYEKNIGIITPMIANKLTDAEKDYPKGWILEAIEIAVSSNVRKWSYINGILKRWKVEGKGNEVKKSAPSHTMDNEGRIIAAA